MDSNEVFDKLAERIESSQLISINVDHRQAELYIPSFKEKNKLNNDTTYASILRNNILEKIKKIIEQNKNFKVIELGCGSGWLSLEMARFGAQVIAYDSSSEVIKIANQMKKENKIKNNFGSLKYVNQDMEKFESKKESVDLIISWESLYYAKNSKSIMKKIKKALKPNRYLVIIQSTNQGNIENYLSYLFEFFMPTYNKSYKEKIILAYRLIFENSVKREITHYIPIRDFLNRHKEILKNIYKDYNVIFYEQDLAFCSIPMTRLKFKNKFLRYFIQNIIKKIDGLLCLMKIVRGTRNIYFAKKK